MDEGLEALKKLLQCITDTRFNTREFVDIALDVEKYNSVIEKELKDFEYLKSLFSIEWFDNLPTDDKIKVIKIMGIDIGYE